MLDAGQLARRRVGAGARALAVHHAVNGADDSELRGVAGLGRMGAGAHRAEEPAERQRIGESEAREPQGHVSEVLSDHG